MTTSFNIIQGPIGVTKLLNGHNLPAFVYKRDAKTGQFTQVLITENTDAPLDPNYGIDQEWLLNNRQGDEYDRLAEWNQDPIPADEEAVNEDLGSSLTEGMVYGPLPKEPQQPISSFYTQYQRAREYERTQEQELED